jgi:hypothetical protein
MATELSEVSALPPAPLQNTIALEVGTFANQNQELNSSYKISLVKNRRSSLFCEKLCRLTASHESPLPPLDPSVGSGGIRRV